MKSASRATTRIVEGPHFGRDSDSLDISAPQENVSAIQLHSPMNRKTQNDSTALWSLAEQILASAKLSPKQREFWKHPMRDLKKLVGRDYNQALRENIGRTEALELIALARKLWPELNRERIATPSNAELNAISKRLSVYLSIRECRERDGMALRGFYVRSIAEMAKNGKQGGLIYLNTAHHPAAVGATFCHEIGHHLAHGIIGNATAEPSVHFFVDGVYSSHLDDPIEFAADILVSLAAYPNSAAKQMFTGKLGALSHWRGPNFDRLLDYLHTGWGLDFTHARQPKHHLIYLAGMVHYAKLRQALLTEYQI